jgi:hypothetical protein
MKVDRWIEIAAVLLRPQMEALKEVATQVGRPPHIPPHSQGDQCVECDKYRKKFSTRFEGRTFMMGQLPEEMKEELRRVESGEDEITS